MTTGNASTGQMLPRSGHFFAWAGRQREAVLVVFIFVGCVALTIATPDFLTEANLKAILLGMADTGIIAVGMTILLVSGGFDLSVGSVLALSGIVAGRLLVAGTSAPIAVLAGLAAGAAVGLVNGLFVAKLGINPLIQTLGMMGVIRGVVYLLGGGFGVAGLSKPFTSIGQSSFFGLGSPIWIMVVTLVLGDFWLRRGRVLRQMYYIGGNEKAARLAGIRVVRLKMGAYVLSGFMAALAGIVLTSRFGSASVSAGTGAELTVIAAVVIGGASLTGGAGTVAGAALGVLLLQLINNALNLLGVGPNWQGIAIGTVLIVAVATDAVIVRLKEQRS